MDECPIYDLCYPYLRQEDGICTLDDAQYHCEDMAAYYDEQYGDF